MNGRDFRTIRKRLGFTQDRMARELGYRGTWRNNKALLERYEQGSKQVPPTVARLAWLIDEYEAITGHPPVFPVWPGYELEPVAPCDEEDETLDSA